VQGTATSESEADLPLKTESAEMQRPVSQVPATVVIGTAGHIDHGKTALIRALTGVDTDRLPEEKRRGITIDLGFASLDLGDGRAVSFIDVPGHARFVRNMLAGAGSIDAVLLAISAEEGVKPQTEEHLAICAMLGIERGLTVLTKADAVDGARLNQVRLSVERFLSNSFLASAPIVSSSARTGAGLDDLRRELRALAARIPPRSSEQLTRIPLDRAFTVKGFGTVATGTLIAGSIDSGQELAVEPSGRIVKVRGLQVHGHAAPAAHAATRVAVNLARIETAELRRGDTLVEPGTATAVNTIDAEVVLLAGASALKHRARVHFHAFTSEAMATVSLYDYLPLEEGATGLARLRLATPMVLLPGDHFVLRLGSPLVTVGGGRVLDAHPLVRGKRRHTERWLQELRAATPSGQIAMRVARRGKEAITGSELAAEAGLNSDAVRALLAPLLKDGSVLALGDDLLLARAALRDSCDEVGREFDALTQQRGTPTVKRSALRSYAGMRQEVLDCALQRLAEEGKLRMQGELLFPAAMDADAAEREQKRLLAICRTYEEAGLAPPSTSEIAAKLGLDAAEMRRLIALLLREKKIVRLGDDSLFAGQNALAGLRQQLQGLRGQTIDVARFKQLTGLSRKYVIPLLEYLDRERVTRREGDRRLVL
jgi:selenocysteine-specific elongation factor